LIEVSILAAALGLGVDWRVVGVLAIALFAPFLAALGIGIHVLRSRGVPESLDAKFCHAVAGELRSGSSLRHAVAESARALDLEEVASGLDAGRAWDQVLPVLVSRLPGLGAELAMVIESLWRSGADAAYLFDELGDIALARIEVGNEVRVATSSARASTAVLVALPLLYLAYMAQTGRIAGLFSHPGTAGLAAVGLSLAVAGLGISFFIVRSAR